MVIEGFFAFVWFGWGQASPPAYLVVPLALGAAASLVPTAVGVATTFRSSGSLPAASDPVVRRRYGIIFGVEVAAIAAGAVVLSAAGLSWWLPAWICAVVGVHFFPMAAVLDNPSLRPLGLMLTAVATAALIAGLATPTAPSTITGLGAGATLLVFAVATGIGSSSRRRR